MITTERFNCTFPLYPENVQLSKARAAKYWKPKDKLPAKYAENIGPTARYGFIPKGKNNTLHLYDKVDKCFVVKNSRSVGTPRSIPINSQIVWESGNTNVWSIRATKTFLAEWFGPGIARQLPEKIFTPSADLFIHIEYIFYYPFGSRTSGYQDYINHWYIRGKVFEDTLVSKGVIPDDGPRYIRGGYARYVNVDNEADRRLEIKIHFCKNGQRISGPA